MILSAVWLLIGLLAGEIGIALALTLSQLLCGLMASFGGIRTPQGRLVQGQVVGLRRYLKTIPADQRKQICQHEPEFFHNMAPFALALGVDKAFAKRFGKQPMEDCPYITTGIGGTLRANQWMAVMRQVLKGMNSHPEQSRLERIVQTIQSFMK